MKLKELMENEKLQDYVIHEFDNAPDLLAAKQFYGWGDEVGEFNIHTCGIKSLQGAPKVVTIFMAPYNDFTNLVGGPRYAKNTYSVSSCKFLKSLKGAPEYVGWDFECFSCDLTQSSLKYLPKYIGNSLIMGGNKKITSLHDIHMYVHHIGGYIVIPSTIKSHMMGLMKIKGLKDILTGTNPIPSKQLQQAVEIMNRHLDGKGNFFDCLEELEDAGLEEFAQL